MIGPQIDHLCWFVDDPASTETSLRGVGLGNERGMYYPRAGTQHCVVPLLPPQCLEFMTIVNRQDATSGDVGGEVLAAEAAGGGLFAWAVLVEDLDATARRHGLDIDDYTLPQPDGTLRGWRTASGPSHLPFFIDYPNNGNRSDRLMAGYERVGHTCCPTSFTRLVVEGDAEELLDWIGPNELPVEHVPGSRGLTSAEIGTSYGAVSVPDLSIRPSGG